MTNLDQQQSKSGDKPTVNSSQYSLYQQNNHSPSQQQQPSNQSPHQPPNQVLALLREMTSSLESLYLLQSIQDNPNQSLLLTQSLQLYHQIVQKLVENRQLTLKGEKLRQMACVQRSYVREIEEWQDEWERMEGEPRVETRSKGISDNKTTTTAGDKSKKSTTRTQKSTRKAKTRQAKTPRAKGANSSIFYHKTDRIHTPSHLHYHDAAMSQSTLSPHTFVFELDEEEFAAIPKYVRGRVTLEQLNDFIQLLNKCLEEKYQAIALNWRDKEFDEQQETRETEGFFWISDRKLIETGKWKLGMKGKNLLGCLRFVKKAKIEKSTEQTKIIVLEVTKSHA